MNKKISLSLAIIAIIVVSSIGLAGVNASIVGQSSMAANMPNGLTQRSNIRINGWISQWETSPTATSVKGMLQTQARVGTFENGNTNQLASATAIWTNSTSRPLNSVALKVNFTYTFYEARLANASVSSLSASTTSANYVLSGTWKFLTVVNNVTVITNDAGQITAVHRTMDKSVKTATGDLTVTNNWSKFTLSITGVDPLTGTVIRYVQRQVAFNPFKVTDDISSNVVTKADLAAVIHAYGAMPGWGNYESRMDFCGHYKIDIANLATVAANM